MAHKESELSMTQIVGHNVKKWRLLRRMTVEELATYVRISRSNITRLEMMRGGCQFQTLGMIAEALQVDLVDLTTVPEEEIGKYVDERVPKRGF